MRRKPAAAAVSPVRTNLALNVAWTLIFFRGRSPLAAGVAIVVLKSTTVALVVAAWPPPLSLDSR
jgi:tryptophan-rich sensory protein